MSVERAFEVIKGMVRPSSKKGGRALTIRASGRLQRPLSYIARPPVSWLRLLGTA